MRRLLCHLETALLLPAILLFAAPALAQLRIDPATETRIDALLARMTLAEKVGQLNQHSSTFDVTGPPPASGSAAARYRLLQNGGVGSMLNVTGTEATRSAQRLVMENSRLGIPLLFGYDVIHGYKTMAPIPLAEVASWDLEAVERSARMAATEAAAAGIHWTFAPMLDIARDSRWGRIMESAGEDPYLGARMAAARVRGFQGEDLAAADTVAACAKHFAGYGFAEGGRDYNTVDFSLSTLHNVVLPPFKAAVDAGVATLMNSFNEIGGTPVTASSYLQRTILKEDWGFPGFMVSDWSTVSQLIPHGVAADTRHAAHLAIEGGTDMDMESGAYSEHLASLVESGEVDVALIDDAVRRILRVKFALGLFDDPYRYSDAEREASVVLSDEMHAASLEMARRSIVLLKNEAGILPLAKDGGTIAVIGPLADDKDTPLGSWRGQAVPFSAVSLLEGIRAAVSGGVTVRHAQGAPLAVGLRSFVQELTLNETDRSGFPAAVEAARGADTVILALGEVAFQSGEARSQVDIGLKGVQEDLLREVQAVNPNIVLVLMNGRPLTLSEEALEAPAIVEAWHLGSQAGHAIADVLFGDVNPSGKLPVSFPRHVGQEPLYYNHKNTGRPVPRGMVFWSHYTDAPNSPQFPFGHGLSYTTFEYSEPRLSAAKLAPDGTLEVRVTVTNSGERDGAEVVQLYIHDVVASTTRPVKELKGFRKIRLAAGESREVTFELRAEDLAFYTARGVWEAEPGDFRVFVGGSSADVLSGRFELLPAVRQEAAAAP